jgi:hypothetical protein
VQAASEHNDLRGVVAIGCLGRRCETLSSLEKATLARQLAGTVGPGLLFRRYAAVAEETERASAVLSQRLATTEPRTGGARA